MKQKKKKIKIVYKDLGKQLGYWDPKTAEIVVNSRQSKEQQDIVLIHECLHAVAELLKQNKFIKILPSHDFIEKAAYNLLYLFKQAKKWR